MAKADPHDMTSASWHRINTTICAMCQAHYCLSCDWGCPTYQFGAGLDRREVARVTEPPIQVRILPDGAE